MLERFPATVLSCATQSHCLNASHFQWNLEAPLKYSIIYPLPMGLLIPFLCHTLLQSCHFLPASIGRGCWGIGNGERPELLCVGDGWFLSAPVGPIARHSWRHSAMWGILGKTYLEGSKCCWGVSEKVWETALWTLGRTEGEMLQALEQRFPCRWQFSAAREEHPRVDTHTANHGVPCRNRYPHCSTWRIPCQRRWQVLKETAAHGGPMLEHGKTVWRKEHQRWIDWTSWTGHRPHSPSSLHRVEGERSGNEGMNFSLGKRVKGRWESVVLILS